MAFPSSPTSGQEYTQDGRTWKWDGVAWEILALAGPAGPPGVISATAPLALASGVLTINLSNYLPVSGGTLDVNATIDASTATVASTFSGDAFGVQLSANPSENSSLQYGGLQVQNFSGTMSVTPAGLTFPNSSSQTIAFPGFNNTALTGAPTAPTLAVDTNTTGIASTAYVVGQAGSATPLVDGTAAVGTSLRYARQDHVHGTDTTRAAVDSQVFTGTPTLPTGTIATTQSPGNNTTAVATTAFVTAAVPAFATTAEALACVSTTAALNPLQIRNLLSNAGYTHYSSMIGNYSSYQSGTGGISIYSDYVSAYVNVANGKIGFSPSSALNINSMQGRGTAEMVMNWTKPMWFSYRFHYGAAIGSNANTICRVTVGKTASTFGDLSSRGFGIKWDGSTTGLFTVMAHNGTTLSTVASSVSVSTTAYFPTNTSSADFLVYSDGAGNVTLFCNNVQIATTTGGPSSGSGAARFIFETDNTTSTTGMCAPTYMGIRSFFAY